MGRGLVLVLALALVAAPVAVGAAADPAGRSKGPQLVAAYPNPVSAGDAGEFVTLAVPPDTPLGEFRIADGESSVALPNVTAAGRVVLSTAPERTRPLVDDRVRPLGDIELANTGESLRLVRDGDTVDALSYEDAPEGSLRVPDSGDGWRPLGATDRPVVTGGPGTVRAFVLPDGGDVALDHLRRADDRILLGAYTLTSERVADALVAAHRRNVSVRVLVDGSPVGGFPRREARLLDRLERAGIDVRAVGGPSARYAFHHAKYAVVDGRALVTTENWKPAGVGGASSRGWGVITDQPRVVDGLVATFRADAGWRDAVPWDRFHADRSFVETNVSTGSYPTRFPPESVPVDRTRLLVAPDNAESAVVGVVDNATETLVVEQVSVGGRTSPFLQAALDAAERGVSVRILLSSAWYVREDNERLVTWLNDRAASRNLPLEARTAAPRGRFEKIHTKGVVVDGDQVVLGSLNWNNHSARENREVAVVLDGETVGTYFGRVFDADWQTRPSTPVGLLLAVAVAAIGALLLARRLRFERGSGGIPPPGD